MNLHNQYNQDAKQFLTNCVKPILSHALILGIVMMAIFSATHSAQAADTQPENDGRSIQIVGGQPATPGEWPWQAYVRSGPYMCGGTLIEQGWVVTAAHCVMNNKGEVYAATEIRVTLGEHDRTKIDGTEQQINIIQVLPHPDYNAQSNNNDIALLQLATPATLGNGVGVISPVVTPADDALVAADAQAMVTGWGATREGGAIATELMEVMTPIVTNEACSLSYGALTGNMLCAGYAEGGKDACQGDSGGPLVVPTNEGGWKLAGVVSFGYGCARANFYGVYTRVSNYVTWMEQAIGSSLSTPTTPVGTEAPVDNGPIALSTEASATLLPDQAITVTVANANGATFLLEIPAGTVESETVIHVRTTAANTAQANTVRIGSLALVVSASRSGLPIDQLTFNKAITVKIHYTTADVSTIDTTALTVFTFQAADGQWSTQNATVIEHTPATSQLVVAISQTGEYALGAPNRLVFLPVIAR